MELLIISLMCAFRLVPLFLAAKIMSQKDRSPMGGFLLGLFVGWIGVIIAAFWPEGDPINGSSNYGARQMRLPEPTIIDDIHFTPTINEPEYVDSEIVPADAYIEKTDRLCAYCNQPVPKTAMYCTSCGKLLDVY